MGDLPSLLLVGCGKMGGAMLTGWLEADLIAGATVVEPGPIAHLDDRVTRVESGDGLSDDFRPDIVVLAVKPQVMGDIVPFCRRFADGGAVMVSLAAGKTIAWFADAFGADAAIVRAMPNTPAAIGRGATVAIANDRTTEGQRDWCDRLLGAVGTVDWIGDESLMDAVTALSGGGPAYVFLLIEVMAAAGIKAGLPPDLALSLARTTVAGAGELARQSAEPVAQLRANVTSPKGTTEAALAVLMGDGGMAPLFEAAIAAAAARGRVLAG